VNLNHASNNFNREWLAYKTVQAFYGLAKKIEVIGLSEDEIKKEIHTIEKDIEFTNMDERVFNLLSSIKNEQKP
jgi:hypothetical protein